MKIYKISGYMEKMDEIFKKKKIEEMISILNRLGIKHIYEDGIISIPPVAPVDEKSSGFEIVCIKKQLMMGSKFIYKIRDIKTDTVEEIDEADSDHLLKRIKRSLRANISVDKVKREERFEQKSTEKMERIKSDANINAIIREKLLSISDIVRDAGYRFKLVDESKKYKIELHAKAINRDNDQDMCKIYYDIGSDKYKLVASTGNTISLKEFGAKDLVNLIGYGRAEKPKRPTWYFSRSFDYDVEEDAKDIEKRIPRNIK